VDDATALAARIRAGELSPAEAAAQAADACEAADATLHALVELFDDAIDRPTPADGPLRGVPLLLKDLGSGLAGRRQEQGSRLHAGHVVTETAPFVANALAAGLVPIGRTAVPELGYAFDTTTDDRGAVHATRNPHDPARTAGGSSGGSAALVAAGAIPIATASDGGGSIRIPAAWCGLVGLKAQRGRFPRAPGGNELTARLSQEGVVTRTVRDTALAFDVLQAMPAGGSFMPVARASASAVLEHDPGRLRVALSTGAFGRADGCDPAIAELVRTVARRLEGLGHAVAEADDADVLDLGALWEPFVDDWIGSAVTLDAAGGDPRPLLTPMVARHLDRARRRTALAAARSQAMNAVVTRSYGRFLERFDLLLTPVTPIRAPAAGGAFSLLRDEDLEPWITRFVDAGRYTMPHNETGAPAIAIPAGRDPDGLPVGAQLAGRFGGEVQLLQVARQLELTGA
jgi:amidase